MGGRLEKEQNKRGGGGGVINHTKEGKGNEGDRWENKCGIQFTHCLTVSIPASTNAGWTGATVGGPRVVCGVEKGP